MQAGGKCLKLPAEADASSNTLKIRVEVVNPTARRAGERVKVAFPPRDRDQATTATKTTTRNLASGIKSASAGRDVRGGEK